MMKWNNILAIFLLIKRMEAMRILGNLDVVKMDIKVGDGHV